MESEVTETLAERVERYYEQARPKHGTRCECDRCEGVRGLYRVARELMQQVGAYRP